MGLGDCLLRTLVVSVICFSLADNTCVYNVCTCNKNQVTCQHLDQIPPLFNGSDVNNITGAFFVDGNITTVGDNSLPPKLEVLHFNINPILNISLNAFQASASTLTSLLFRRVAFTKLPDALLKLQNLTHMAIYDTVIQDWNKPVLQHLHQTLRSVNLENVGFTEWPMWLSEFPLLESIVVAYSIIAPIPDSAFSRVPLKILNLLADNLTVIFPAISKLNLTSLLLSNNNFSDVGGIPRSNYIDLKDNLISNTTSLTSALILSSDVLHSLQLANNKLTVIPDLSKMTKMEYLFLDYNQISDAASGFLPQSLVSLNLKGNKLTSVPNDIASLPNLQSLDLSFNLIDQITHEFIPSHLRYLNLESNRITKITSLSFPGNSFLILLQLRNNPVSQIDNSGFKQLQKLENITLDNTQLISIPEALSALINLKGLSMENNPNLECTLPLNCDLFKWFSSDKGLEVKGYCNGSISIKNFYTTSENPTTCGFGPLFSNLWITLPCVILPTIFSILHI